MHKTLQLDALVAEIGSTTTVVNAFDGLESPTPRFLGQGQAPSSVEAGDVRVGLDEAIVQLKAKLQVAELSWKQFMASSSAAGGLQMSVHGLVYDMTVRAAKEACLGSGGVVQYVTAGRLRPSDFRRIKDLAPKILFVAGGTDYGERDTALGNAEALMRECPGLPMIYAGNIVNHAPLQDMAQAYQARLYLSENVYPSLDQLEIEGARRLIHEVFEASITESPGMEALREQVDGRILPTPGAVMEAALLAASWLGDVLVFDVGGATSDVHSVSEGHPQHEKLRVQAEPRAKRTVEGDLGLYVNRFQLLDCFDEAEKRAFFPEGLEALPKIPRTDAEKRQVARLCAKALERSLERHAGRWISYYEMTGTRKLLKGKDLTAVKAVLGTGGALTRLPSGQALIRACLEGGRKDQALPAPDLPIYLDHDYHMAALGVLSQSYPQAALTLLKQSLRKDNACDTQPS